MGTKYITLSLFFGFSLLYLIVAFYIAYVLNIYHNDAISRTALAFFTIFGRNPHLAAIGFVWQPLPSLLQLPLLVILRPLGYIMMAGPTVSAICGALSVIAVYKTSLMIIKKRRVLYSAITAVLFGLNPLILLYASIGTSEMVFIASLLLSTYFMVRWITKNNLINLITSSLFLSLSFWSRYESLPMFLGYFLLIIYAAKIKKLDRKHIEGALVQFSLPFIYSVLIWVGVNYFIMHDPFYFLHSEYSNTAFTQSLKDNPASLEYSYNSVLGSVLYGVKRVAILSPILLLLPLFFLDSVIILKKKLENSMLLLAVTFPYICVILFHIYQLYKGDSFGWLRFFIYAIPAGTFLSAYAIRRNPNLTIPAVLFLLLSGIVSFIAITTPTQGKEEISFLQKVENPKATLDYSRTYKDQKAVSALMDTLPGRALLDTNKGFAIPLFSKNPNKYIITSDIDYIKIVKKYYKNVNWIILRKPQPEDLTLNKLYKYYPGIWEGNAPHVTLYKEIDDWRIFFVDIQLAGR